MTDDEVAQLQTIRQLLLNMARREASTRSAEEWAAEIRERSAWMPRKIGDRAFEAIIALAWGDGHEDELE